MSKATRLAAMLGLGALALYGAGIYGARSGWFWTVELTFEEDGIGGIVSGPNGPEAEGAHGRWHTGSFIRIRPARRRARPARSTIQTIFQPSVPYLVK